jgi:ryanodine receptor 2
MGADSQPARYQPLPIDTSATRLSDDLKQLSEALAANAHDVWAAQRLREGWQYGPVRDDGLLQHPCLVPYDQLPEAEKVYDRKLVAETLRAILVLGYEIRRKTRDPHLR